ncbi:MAG: TetR/AcrR family transcriptional regulator [Faecousia sp.]
MNPGITSKEAILQVCREIASEQGLPALNMRAVAKKCGIALGTLYNYFPDKDALLLATVESIWADIFHRNGNWETGLPFPDYVVRLFDCVREGAAEYPNFLTSHSIAIAKSKRSQAKSAMEQCFSHMKAGLLEALRSDPKADSTAFSGDLTQADFVDFVLDTLLLMLAKGQPEPTALVALARRVLYR